MPEEDLTSIQLKDAIVRLVIDLVIAKAISQPMSEAKEQVRLWLQEIGQVITEQEN